MKMLGYLRLLSFMLSGPLLVWLFEYIRRNSSTLAIPFLVMFAFGILYNYASSSKDKEKLGVYAAWAFHSCKTHLLVAACMAGFYHLWLTHSLTIALYIGIGVGVALIWQFRMLGTVLETINFLWQVALANLPWRR